MPKRALASEEGRACTCHAVFPWWIISIIAVVALLMSPAFALVAADVPSWSQFRGPSGGGVAPDGAVPPLGFGPGKNLLWVADSGVGHGSLSIWGNRVFLLSYDATEKGLETVALDRTTGARLWRQVLAAEEIETHHRFSNPATATPATDGERVYVYFGSYGLAAYTMDGETAWEYPLPTARTRFGSGTSPVVHSGLVLLNYDGQPEPVVYALNASDGSLQWKRPLEPHAPIGSSHATPVVWNGRVVIHGVNSVTGLELTDGAPCWRLIASTTGVATPVTSPGTLYVPAWSNYGDAAYFPAVPSWPEILAAYDKDQDGKLTRDESPADLLVMKRPGLADDTPGAHVSLRGVFASIFDLDKDGYLTGEELEQVGAGLPKLIQQHGLTAVRAGGEGDITTTHVAWKEPRGAFEVPSPILYRDRIYAVGSGGIVICMDANDGRVVFRGRLGTPGEYYASPVAANGRLYFTSRDGVVTVIEAGDELRVLARNDLEEDVFASPAIVGDTLYIRTATHVYAFSVTE